MNKGYEVTLAWVMKHHDATSVIGAGVDRDRLHVSLVPKGLSSEDTGRV
jgi:hypothetical protein